MKRRPHLAVLGAVLLASALSAAAQAPAPPEPGVGAEITAPKNRVFSNEVFQITLSIRATNVRLAEDVTIGNLFQEGSLFQVGGFRELEPQRSQQGTTYTEVRRFVCDVRATRPGPQVLSPQVRGAVKERRAAFFGATWVDVGVTIPTRPLPLTVVGLPEAGRPADFSGVIGELSFDADVAPLNVAPGDLITARLRVSGSGYLENLRLPRFLAGPHLKVYEPKPIPTANAGERVFEQVLIPQSSNAVQIAALSFSYFDTKAEAYRTITRGPFPLTFHAPEAAPPPRPRLPLASTNRPAAGEPAAAGPASAPGPAVSVRTRRLFSDLMNGTLGCPEMVTVRDVRARLAPGASAMTTFEIRQGSTVHVLEQYQDWTKVAASGDRGWIPSDALAGSR